MLVAVFWWDENRACECGWLRKRGAFIKEDKEFPQLSSSHGCSILQLHLQLLQSDQPHLRGSREGLRHHWTNCHWLGERLVWGEWQNDNWLSSPLLLHWAQSWIGLASSPYSSLHSSWSMCWILPNLVNCPVCVMCNSLIHSLSQVWVAEVSQMGTGGDSGCCGDSRAFGVWIFR